jgi:hypothetical protein
LTADKLGLQFNGHETGGQGDDCEFRARQALAL